MKKLGTPCLIHQASYNMFNRSIEKGLLDILKREKMGCIAFSTLAQGLLTDRYLKGIPEDSRASKPHGFLKPANITDEKLNKGRSLNDIALQRGQTLAQMSLAWVLSHPDVTSALIGASRISQIEDAVGFLNNMSFSSDEIERIEDILKE